MLGFQQPKGYARFSAATDQASFSVAKGSCSLNLGQVFSQRLDFWSQGQAISSQSLGQDFSSQRLGKTFSLFFIETLVLIFCFIYLVIFSVLIARAPKIRLQTRKGLEKLKKKQYCNSVLLVPGSYQKKYFSPNFQGTISKKGLIKFGS